MSLISVPDLGLLSAVFAVCVVPVCVPIALVPAAPRDLPARGLLSRAAALRACQRFACVLHLPICPARPALLQAGPKPWGLDSASSLTFRLACSCGRSDSFGLGRSVLWPLASFVCDRSPACVLSFSNEREIQTLSVTATPQAASGTHGSAHKRSPTPHKSTHGRLTRGGGKHPRGEVLRLIPVSQKNAPKFARVAIHACSSGLARAQTMPWR